MTARLPPGPPPAYSSSLEFAVSLLMRSMDPVSKLALARRMLDVFRYIEAQALEALGGADRNTDRDGL